MCALDDGDSVWPRRRDPSAKSNGRLQQDLERSWQL